MSRFFDIDSPLMNGLNKFADLMILNLITLACCIPVITIGPAITACHFVALKIVRNEENYIIKTFFRSFKQNFRQAAIIWIIQILLVLFFVYDFWIIRNSGIEFPQWVVVGVVIVAAILVAVNIYVYPLLAKFDNTIAKTYKNSFLVSLLIWPKTILMIIMWIVPLYIAIYLPQILPVDILFGISGPAFVSALLYNKTFKKFEPQEETIVSDEEWTLEVLDEDENVIEAKVEDVIEE